MPPSRLLSRSARPSRPFRSIAVCLSIRNVSSTIPLIHIQNGTFYRCYPTTEPDSQEHNPPLFPNFNFTLPSKPDSSRRQGENPLQHWAVIGSTGTTALLDILRGQYIVLPPTARSYPYLSSDEIATKEPRLRYPDNAIRYVGFRGEGSQSTGGTRGAYLSARYESHTEETDWTVQQYLNGQTFLNPLESQNEGDIHDAAFFGQVVAKLRLEKLLGMPIANLSNGQTRRARIAKALLHKPELLLLDEPFMGLDPTTVSSISTLLLRLAETSSPRLILSLRPQDILPDWITHLIILGNRHHVLFQGDRLTAEGTFEVWKMAAREYASLPSSLPVGDSGVYDAARKAINQGIMSRELLRDLRLIEVRPEIAQVSMPYEGDPIVEMEGVRVRYGEKTVLGGWKQKVNKEEKEGLHWKVRRGQRWAIVGANGSGKTTLLSLITSDHPQTYALSIRLFGRSRLPEPGQPGISIFDLQSRIGHSSPEVHAFFPRHLSVRQSIESAWAETFLSRPVLDYDRDLDVNAALGFFKSDLDPTADAGTPSKKRKQGPEAFDVFPKLPRPRKRNLPFKEPDSDVEYADSLQFSSLSLAQQRLVLFIRSIVHKPDLVILDEAFSGMSPTLRDKCFHFLQNGELKRKRRVGAPRKGAAPPDRWLSDCTVEVSKARHKGLSKDQALIIVSHVKEEIPGCVRHWMRLPSDDSLGDLLDFRMGFLKPDGSWQTAWDAIWSTRNMGTRPCVAEHHQKSLEATTVYGSRDADMYEFWTI